MHTKRLHLRLARGQYDSTLELDSGVEADLDAEDNVLCFWVPDPSVYRLPDKPTLDEIVGLKDRLVTETTAMLASLD